MTQAVTTSRNSLRSSATRIRTYAKSDSMIPGTPVSTQIVAQIDEVIAAWETLAPAVRGQILRLVRANVRADAREEAPAGGVSHSSAGVGEAHEEGATAGTFESDRRIPPPPREPGERGERVKRHRVMPLNKTAPAVQKFGDRARPGQKGL